VRPWLRRHPQSGFGSVARKRPSGDLELATQNEMDRRGGCRAGLASTSFDQRAHTLLAVRLLCAGAMLTQWGPRRFLTYITCAVYAQ